MANGQNFGFMSFSSPPLVLGQAGQTASGFQPVSSGFNFMLPMATIAAFNNQAMSFQAGQSNNALNFLNNISAGAAAFGQNALNQNVGLNNSAQASLSSYLNNLGQVSLINAQTGAYQAGHPGGLFGGGGFLGLGW